MSDDISALQDGPLTTAGIDDEPAAAAGEESTAPPESRLRKNLKRLGWTAFFGFCLLLFTLLKLPEDRIKNYVQGMVASFLAPKGITFSTERGYVSLGFGISYVMKNVTLTLPPPEAPVKLDKLSVTPSILPLALGFRGATLWLYQGKGTLSATVSTKGPQVSGSFKADAIDLGKLGVLPIAAGIRGGGVVTGSGSFSGDMSIPSTLNGDASLSLSKVVIEQQSIMGFSIPRLNISEGKIELGADKGKATIKTFRLGKTGNAADDIQANATGDIMLSRNWDSSTINAKANFKLSESVLKSLVLLDALLGAGKQGDGSYTYRLTGPLTMPQALP